MIFYKEIFTVKASKRLKLKAKKTFSSFGGHCRLQGRPCLLSRDQPEIMFVKGELNGVKASTNSRRLYVQNQLSHLPLSTEESLTIFLMTEAF